MRKAQKQQAEVLVRQMEEAHDQIKKFIEQGSLPSAMELLEECQNGGITLGTLIEQTEGEGHPTVMLLEDYCELTYQIHENLAENRDININKIYKLLRQKLIKAANSIKNDIHTRIEAVFLPYKASMWDSLESVWMAADEDENCDAYVIPIPYYDRSPDGSFCEMHYEADQYPDYVPIIKYDEFDFGAHRPDMIFIHNAYDKCNLVTSVHPFFYTDNLKRFTDCLVYIPYYMTTGGMSEGQGFCPSYMNVDYIVIQSPKFRDYFDERIPDEKFLPFGSPKADRVIRKCQNPPVPPKEWQEKMAGKRVYFYNTSISGMLADTDNFLKKMQYVFSCFEGRDDVCILWRPHPLLEATFQSMRPQQWASFQELKKYYIEKEIGILDTTADIEDSIALSDAYIGDAGTSVTALFGVAGKPMFILDNRIHKKPDKDSWREKIGVGFDLQEQNRFTIVQANKLYISEPEQYDYRYFCDLSNNHRREYHTVLQINGKRYVYPSSVQNILVIGDNGVERTIELENEMVDGPTFFGGWKYDRFLILLPFNYPALVRFDTTTEECLYVKENMDVYIREKDGCKIFGGSLIYQGNLYLSSPIDNKICKFDINGGKMEVVEIPIQSRCGCKEFVEHRGEMWMLPYIGKVIVRWNLQTGETMEYTGFPDEFSCVRLADNEELLFNSMAFYGDYLYLAPQYANIFLRLNTRTGQFTQWKTPFDEESQAKNMVTGIRSRNSVFIQSETEENDYLKLYSCEKRRLYNINMKTDAWEEIEIKFNLKDLEEHATGFRECSEKLKYACMENIFSSLDRFLDNETMGNSFDRDKQFLAYSEIIANIDGSCGRKVYEYIKEQG